MSDLRIYIVINNSVQMSKGKIVSQACHAMAMMTETMLKRYPTEWERYKRYGQAKIVLKAPEELMSNLIKRYSDPTERVFCHSVRDAGLTQVESGTLTSLIFCPLRKEEIPNEIKFLKLL